MSLLVLGEGWLGTAVAAVARRTMPVATIDPPLDPVMHARDAAARGALRDLVRASSAMSVVNACGLVRGDGDALHDANAEFPRWVCQTLDGLGVRLVHVGSASEYGDPGTDRPVDETTPPRPTGAYAETKAAGTEAVLRARSEGLDAVVSRVFNVVGHPVPAVSPLHQWITDLRQLPPGGGEVEVWWPPTVRDFVRITDVAASLVHLAAPGERPGIVNVCSGVGLAYGDIVEALAGRLGVRATIRSLERPGIATVVGDPTLLSGVTGSTPPMDLVLLARTALPEEAPADLTADVPGGAAADSR
jgi:NDP-hexose 4-ketoreductase